MDFTFILAAITFAAPPSSRMKANKSAGFFTNEDLSISTFFERGDLLVGSR